MKCEHGITPATDCYVCVSAPTGAEDDACDYRVVLDTNGGYAPCHLQAGHDGPHLVDADVLTMMVSQAHDIRK